MLSPFGRVLSTVLAFAGASFFSAACGRAQSVLTFNLDTVFSSATNPAVLPSASIPWLTATFVNQGNGVVRLTMTVSDLPTGEYVDDWAFNLNPAKDPSQLNFTLVGTSPTTLMKPIEHSTDVFKADGDGKYDIHFAFSNGGASRFASNEQLIYDISLTGATLFASDFNFLSAPAGGSGPFYVAAHINGIPTSSGTTSAWVTIPEPRMYALMCSAFVGVYVFVRRRNRTEISCEAGRR